MSKRTAWGSFKSPSNPHVIQPYEFVFVFSKNNKKHNGDKKNIDITKEEFVKYSDAFWNIKPETSLSKKHPAPFPEELIYRLLKLLQLQKKCCFRYVWRKWDSSKCIKKNK